MKTEAERRKQSKERAALACDKDLVDKALRRYIIGLKGPRLLREAIKYAVFPGGKRLRPILLLETCKALNGKVKKALPFACAVELAHSFSLVHDDLPAMDDDDFRRNKPACHRKFTEGLAILAGDALLNLAFGIISKTKHKKIRKIITVFSKALGTESMIGGQAMDMEYEKKKKKNVKLKNNIDRMKTAALMAASCRIGALAAVSKTNYINKMDKFGLNFGLAFQIKDDLSDAAFAKPLLRRMEKDINFFISNAKRNITFLGKKGNVLRYITDRIWKNF